MSGWANKKNNTDGTQAGHSGGRTQGPSRKGRRRGGQKEENTKVGNGRKVP